MNQGKPKVTRSRSEWIRKYVNYQSTFLFSDVMIFILLTMFKKIEIHKNVPHIYNKRYVHLIKIEFIQHLYTNYLDGKLSDIMIY